MKLEMYLGRTHFEAFNKMLDVLKKNYSKEENYIVLVPDRFRLFAEQYIMEKLELESVFNLDIMSLNRLADLTCPHDDYIDKETAVMIINKVSMQIKDLTVLKNAVKLNGFAEMIYNIITQIKSSRISAEEFLSCEFKGSEYEIAKKHDIAKIYAEYEKYLDNSGVDGVRKYEYFIEEIKNSNLKDYHFYIGNFDSFTHQGYAVIQELIKCSKSVSISAINSLENQNNKNIYLNDMGYEIKEIAKKLKIECKVDDGRSEILNSQLVENIWATKPIEINSNIEIYSTENRKEQYKFIAETIMYKVIYENMRFKDFNLSVNGLDADKEMIENIFKDYGVAYFTDTSIRLSEHPVSRYIQSIFDCISKNFDNLSVSVIVDSYFTKGTREEKNNFKLFARKYTLHGDDFYKKKDAFSHIEDYETIYNYISEVLSALVKFKNEYGKINTIENYCNGVLEVIKDTELENKFSLVMENHKNNNEINLYKFGEMVFEKLYKLIESISVVEGDETIKFSDFVYMIKSGMYSTKLTLIPSGVDNVFIGDTSESFFAPRKYLIASNVNQGTMPSFKQDTGLFSDSDIENTKTKNKITPTIKVLNSRERLKILSLLSLGKVMMFYIEESDQNIKLEKSDIINQILKLDKNLEIKHILSKTSFYGNESEQEERKFALKFYSKKSSSQQLLNNLNEQKNGEGLISGSILSTICKNDKFKEIYNDFAKEKEQVEYLKCDTDKVFFKDNSVSVTQIERFYQCPYIHFIEKGIGVKNEETDEFSVLAIGNIMHSVCEKSVEYYGKKSGEEVGEEVFNKVINTPEYFHILNNKKNKRLIESLKNESRRLIDALFYQLDNSDFRVEEAEKNFCEKFYNIYDEFFKTETNSDLMIKGKVDRIDIFDKYFKIIDYKTGSESINIQDVYFGKKLQLFIYSAIISKVLKKNPAGVFYFLINNKYYDEKMDKYSKYRLSGMFIDNINVLFALDKKILQNIQKSDIIHINFLKNSTNFEFKRNSDIITEDDFIKIEKCALYMMDKAIKKINEGYIKPSPYMASNKNSCEYCEYYSCCKIDKSKVNFRQISTVGIKELRGIEEDV